MAKTRIKPEKVKVRLIQTEGDPIVGEIVASAISTHGVVRRRGKTYRWHGLFNDVLVYVECDDPYVITEF